MRLPGWFILVALIALSGRAAIAAEEGHAEIPITDYDRDHWAFRPVERTEVPKVQNDAWCRNTIDHFILARLEEKALAPMPEADRLTLLRRVKYDLTGLPPTPVEIAEFLADERTDAFEQLVDRLLESDAYGERMAQHWLDLARYAETDGYEHDYLRPEAWRYRDWVIKAFNSDMPYDRFASLQLAADEIAPGSGKDLLATGFLLCGPDMPDLNLQESPDPAPGPDRRSPRVLPHADECLAANPGDLRSAKRRGRETCAERSQRRFDSPDRAIQDDARLRSRL